MIGLERADPITYLLTLCFLWNCFLGPANTSLDEQQDTCDPYHLTLCLLFHYPWSGFLFLRFIIHLSEIKCFYQNWNLHLNMGSKPYLLLLSCFLDSPDELRGIYGQSYWIPCLFRLALREIRLRRRRRRLRSSNLQ